MITEDYCSFGLSKLLKEKGFDEKCQAMYDKDGHFVPFNFKLLTKADKRLFVADAPTLQMTMKWLREEKGIAIIPVLSSVLDNEKFLWDIKIVVAETYDTYYQGWIYEKQEAACEAAIKYCLTNLI